MPADVEIKRGSEQSVQEGLQLARVTLFISL